MTVCMLIIERCCVRF